MTRRRRLALVAGGASAALALVVALRRSTVQLDDSSPEATFSTSTLPRLVEPLRRLVPDLVVTSGVRSRATNERVGGSDTSQHLAGEAVDVFSPSVPSGRLLRLAIGAGLPIDQGIAYTASEGGHVHLSTRARGPNRGMFGIKRPSGYVWTIGAIDELVLEQEATA